jgi:hypothetical protein
MKQNLVSLVFTPAEIDDLKAAITRIEQFTESCRVRPVTLVSRPSPELSARAECGSPAPPRMCQPNFIALGIK